MVFIGLNWMKIYVLKACLQMLVFTNRQLQKMLFIIKHN